MFATASVEYFFIHSILEYYPIYHALSPELRTSYQALTSARDIPHMRHMDLSKTTYQYLIGLLDVPHSHLSKRRSLPLLYSLCLVEIVDEVFVGNEMSYKIMLVCLLD